MGLSQPASYILIVFPLTYPFQIIGQKLMVVFSYNLWVLIICHPVKNFSWKLIYFIYLFKLSYHHPLIEEEQQVCHFCLISFLTIPHILWMIPKLLKMKEFSFALKFIVLSFYYQN